MRRSTPSPAVPDRHHNWAASGALGVELLDCFNDGGPMILQYGECFLKSCQVTLCRCWIMACSAHRLHLRHLLRDGRLGIGDMGIRFRQPLQFGFAVGTHLTAQAAVLPAVADFLDGLFNGWIRTTSLPCLHLIFLPARDTRPILLASATALLRSLLRHPQSSLHARKQRERGVESSTIRNLRGNLPGFGGRFCCRCPAEHFRIKFSNRLLAFACALFDKVHVQDVDLAAPVKDQAFFLQLARNGGDAGAPHAHHLPNELLRERQLVSNEIVHPNKPLTHALFDTVQRIAGGGLLYLTEEKLIVFDEQGKQVWRRLCYCFEVIRIDNSCQTRHLDDNFMQGQPAIQSLRCTEDAIVSNHAAFDRGAILGFDHAGQYACVREVHLINSCTTLRYYATVLQLDQPEMRAKVFEIDRACSCENTVLCMRHFVLSTALQAGAQLVSQPPTPSDIAWPVMDPVWGFLSGIASQKARALVFFLFNCPILTSFRSAARTPVARGS